MNGPGSDRLATREVGLIAGVSVFLVVVTLAVFAGKPMYAKFRDSGAELDARRMLEDLPGGTGIARLEEDVRELQATLEEVNGNLPEQQLESRMVSAFRSASSQHGVHLITLEAVATTPGLPYRELTFRLELSGSYRNLDNWIHSIHAQLGHVVFNEYVLRVKTPGPEPELSARILLSAYRLREG